MLNLQYVGDITKYPVNFKKLSGHVIQITGKMPIKLTDLYYQELLVMSGRLIIPATILCTERLREEYSFLMMVPCTLRRQNLNRSLNQSLMCRHWKKRRQAKSEEIEMMHQLVTAAGIDVKLSTGIQHFSLGNEDMIFLMGKKSNWNQVHQR